MYRVHKIVHVLKDFGIKSLLLGKDPLQLSSVTQADTKGIRFLQLKTKKYKQEHVRNEEHGQNRQ